MILPRHVLGGSGFVAPSDKVNIAGIGVGGRGFGVLKSFNSDTTNIVALCDVDDVQAAGCYQHFPDAKRYKDFRVMLENQNDFDAVAISTPDNTHAVAAMPSMQLGKHVYVEKPLAHDVFEVRMMTEAAQKYKVASQMGNQGASGAGTWQAVDWVQRGLIGEVTKVHCWTNRPVWPQGVPTPQDSQEVPTTLDWDLWLGPAEFRPYHSSYLPFKWRGWWDFGTGALGDMACHIMDVPFRSLELGYPKAVEASVSGVYIGDFVQAYYPESCPPASKIVYDFPSRGDKPAVKLIWYDGGIMPDRPDELGPDDQMGSGGGGVIMEGTKGKLMCEVYGHNPTLLPKVRMEELGITKEDSPISEGHYENFVNACKGEKKAVSDFDIAGPLTETVLMGNLAIRSAQMRVNREQGGFDYPGRRKLMWDGQNMKITNFDEANAFVKREYREGWSL